jgi:hypothetical protein
MDDLSVAVLFRRDQSVVCICGAVMQVREVSDEGQHGGSVVAGERGTAAVERTCPACWASMTVQVCI